MSNYRFSAASPVGDITFRYANDRPPVGLIAAGKGAGEEQLNVIRRALEAQGWETVPAQAEGKPVLQVQGFKDEGQLVALLVTQSFAKGEPKFTPEPGDHPTRSWKEWLEDSSMKAGGWAYLVGDGALLLSGMMSGRDKEITSGALYTAGGIVAARYGNVKTSHHSRQVAEKLGEQLKAQAQDLPEDCGLYTIMKEKRAGMLPSFENFLYRYPSQTTLGIYTLGAFSMLQSGIKHGKPWDIAYGANSTGSKLASILIPEKHKTEQEKAETVQQYGQMGHVFNWVQEKPLRLFGYASLLSAGLLGMSAYKEYKADPKQKSYIFKFITAGMYTIGDLMFAVSSKDHTNADGKFDTQEQRRIEALAAEMIASQPKAIQGGLAHQAAGFLAAQPEVKGKAEDIAAAINEQVEHMAKNPWACRSTRRQIINGEEGLRL